MLAIKLSGCVLICLAVAGTHVAAQEIDDQTDHSIATGQWTGSFKPPGADETDLELDIEAEGELGLILTIQMLEIEPRDRYRFVAQDLDVGNDSISFRFGRSNDMRTCELALQDNGEYAGKCLREDREEETLPSLIVMEPPTDEPDS